MLKVIRRTGNLLVLGGPAFLDSNGDPLQSIQIPYDGVTAEVKPDLITWYFDGASFVMTFADIPNGDFSNVADQINGAWVGSPAKVEALLSSNYSEQDITGNHLVIMRKFLTAGKTQVLFETVNSQTTTVSDCYAIRFVNCGKNTVMVDQMPLDNNEALDIPGEPNFTLETKFRIIFDDGTTGRPIVKK